MKINTARKYLIFLSLAIISVQMAFLFIAPVVGFPLEYPKNLNILQIVTPVFLGYLGLAVHYIFRQPAPTVTVNEEFLGLLAIGPICVYTIAMLSAFGAFGYANRSGAPIGSGMTFDSLSTSVSLSLGILSAVTSILVSYLFTGERPDSGLGKPGGSPVNVPPAAQPLQPDPSVASSKPEASPVNVPPAAQPLQPDKIG